MFYCTFFFPCAFIKQSYSYKSKCLRHRSRNNMQHIAEIKPRMKSKRSRRRKRRRSREKKKPLKLCTLKCKYMQSNFMKNVPELYCIVMETYRFIYIHKPNTRKNRDTQREHAWEQTRTSKWERDWDGKSR